MSGLISGSEAHWNSEGITELRDRSTDMELQKKTKKGFVHMVREIGGGLVDVKTVDVELVDEDSMYEGSES